MRSYRFLVALAAASSASASYFPLTPEGVTVLKSKFHENVTISYKEVKAYNRRSLNIADSIDSLGSVKQHQV
jgi:hypothetical protein